MNKQITLLFLAIVSLNQIVFSMEKDNVLGKTQYIGGFRDNEFVRHFARAKGLVRVRCESDHMAKFALNHGIIPVRIGSNFAFKNKYDAFINRGFGRIGPVNTRKISKETIIFRFESNKKVHDLFNHFCATLEEAKNNASRGILEIAIENDYAYIVKLLIELGVEIEPQDLELAKENKSKIVHALLTHFCTTLEGAKINPNRTILEIAIKSDYAYIVELLIEVGVEIKLEDLELAKKSQSKIVGKILVKYLQCISRAGLISKDGILGIGNLPDEVILNIAKFMP